MSNSNRNPNNNLQESGINNNIIINLNLQEFQGIIDTNVGELVLQEPQGVINNDIGELVLQEPQGVINNDIGELVLCEPQIIDNSIPELVLQKIPEITNPIIYEPQEEISNDNIADFIPYEPSGSLLSLDVQQRLVDSISNEWKKYSLVTTSIGNTDFYPKLNVKSVSFNTASNGLASEVLGDSNSDHNVELS